MVEFDMKVVKVILNSMFMVKVSEDVSKLDYSSQVSEYLDIG